MTWVIGVPVENSDGGVEAKSMEVPCMDWSSLSFEEQNASIIQYAGMIQIMQYAQTGDTLPSIAEMEGRFGPNWEEDLKPLVGMVNL